jgi:hypothetical protein
MEEGIEASANVSSLIKLPKLSERGCEYSADGRWKVVESVWQGGPLCYAQHTHKPRSNTVLSLQNLPPPPPDGKYEYKYEDI